MLFVDTGINGILAALDFSSIEHTVGFYRFFVAPTAVITGLRRVFAEGSQPAPGSAETLLIQCHSFPRAYREIRYRHLHSSKVRVPLGFDDLLEAGAG